MRFHFLLLLLLLPTVFCGCPAGSDYIPQLGKCLMLMRDASLSNFFDTRDTCRDRGGDLTSIHNAFENAAVWNYAKQENCIGSFFIGATMVNARWGWTDGTAFTYVNWPPGQPTERGLCSTMSMSDGKWYTAVCNQEAISYFCSLPVMNTTVCPKGWTQFENHCYFQQDTHPSWISWNLARSQCATGGSDLVSIHSAEENKFVSDFVKTKYCSATWIGLRYSASLSWSDGTPFDYNNALPAQHAPPTVYFLYPSCYQNPFVSKWQDRTETEEFLWSFVCKKAAKTTDRVGNSEN